MYVVAAILTNMAYTQRHKHGQSAAAAREPTAALISIQLIFVKLRD